MAMSNQIAVLKDSLSEIKDLTPEIKDLFDKLKALCIQVERVLCGHTHTEEVGDADSSGLACLDCYKVGTYGEMRES